MISLIQKLYQRIDAITSNIIQEIKKNSLPIFWTKTTINQTNNNIPEIERISTNIISI